MAPEDTHSTIAQGAPEATGKPTVLQVLPRLDGGGGVERGTLEISRALVRAGWRSLIVSASTGIRGQIGAVGAHHFTIPVASRNPFKAPAAVSRLSALIRAQGVDLVHARSRVPAWLAHWAARRTGRPLVTTVHGRHSLGFPLKKQYNAIMTRGARVIAISDFIADHITETYGVDRARIRVVPRGVDLEIFDPARVNPERIVTLANRWRVPVDHQIVMLPGRLSHLKGQDVLIEAIARLARTDVCCLLVGADHARHALRQDLLQQVERLGLGTHVRFTGSCDDMPAALMLADVVVSASTRPEAFGRVIVEAQAMGRPVVATAHGGALETVIGGETGWLVPPGDADALARAIAKVLTLEPRDRADLAARAQAHVRRNFALSAMCEATLAVYREVLAETQGPPVA